MTGSTARAPSHFAPPSLSKQVLQGNIRINSITDVLPDPRGANQHIEAGIEFKIEAVKEALLNLYSLNNHASTL